MAGFGSPKAAPTTRHFHSRERERLVGYWKHRQMEQDDQGWSYSDKFICPKCVKDTYLREVVRASVADAPCDFCFGARPRKGASFNTLMAAVAQTFYQYFRRAVDHLGWDGEDKDYFGTTYDTWDLVHDQFSDVSDNGAVLKELVDCLGDETWCDENPYGFSGSERYAVSWSEFCRTVKHRTRYFFSLPAASEERIGSDNELIPVPEVLAEVGAVIQDANIDVVLAPDTCLFRARPHLPTVSYSTVETLGPPPEEHAVNNRMSAAGVSVFYGAFDLATALAEVASGLRRGHRCILTAAEWRATRAVHVVDLSRLPSLGSWYAHAREVMAPLVFLRQFVREITRPVVHDGKEHIEYVPTQILTEYLRLHYRSNAGQPLDGIVYPSAQRPGGRSVVIFASHDDLASTFSARPAVLQFVDGTARRVRVPRRASKRSVSRVP